MNKNELQCYDQPEDVGRRKRRFMKVLAIIILFILICLCFRSCRARDEPQPEPDRIYEENHVPSYEDIIPSQENKRLNLAISDSYRITDENPVFYIGFPKENIFDVVFILKDSDGNELYKTNYIAPGTNVAIDGTEFLEKGNQQVECLVSIYSHDSGVLISDCTTVVLNISYE